MLRVFNAVCFQCLLHTVSSAAAVHAGTAAADSRSRREFHEHEQARNTTCLLALDNLTY